MKTNKNYMVEKFIHSYKVRFWKNPEWVKAIENVFLNWWCYVFHKILWINFWWEAYNYQSHVITKINNKFYDITWEIKIDESKSYSLYTEPRIFGFYDKFENFKHI